jgi:glutamine amidotransferase
MKDLEKKYDGLVLPGVGNFDPAMSSVSKNSSELKSAVKAGMPVLGICLGMEMLFDRSEEGKSEGLKFLDGEVILLPKRKVKIPHMGWNTLDISKKARSEFLDGVDDGSWVYFVHSYMASPHKRDVVVATSDYGTKVPAVIEKENLIGVQFHPEKSGEVGGIMLRNFIRMCEKPRK